MKYVTDSPGTEDGTPPPSVVLPWQLEVCQCNGNAGRDAEQDDVNDKQDAIQSELLAAPQCRKDVIQFHRDSTVHTETHRSHTLSLTLCNIKYIQKLIKKLHETTQFILFSLANKITVRKSYWVASPHNTQNDQVRHGSRLFVQWQTRLLLRRGQSLAQPLLVVCGGCSDHQQVQTTTGVVSTSQLGVLVPDG